MGTDNCHIKYCVIAPIMVTLLRLESVVPRMVIGVQGNLVDNLIASKVQ